MPAFRHVCIRLLLLAALPFALARPTRASAETSARWHSFTTLNGLAGDTARDLQRNVDVAPAGAALGLDRGVFQFTFTAAAGWLPAQAIGFRYWIASAGGAIVVAPKVVQSAGSPEIRAVSALEDSALAPGSYTLHVEPIVDGVAGGETLQAFTIRSAPPLKQLARLDDYTAALRDSVRTDLSRDELLQLAGQAAWLKPDDLGRITIDPGMLATLDKPATFALKPEALRQIVGALLGQGQRHATEATEATEGAGQSSALPLVFVALLSLALH